MTITKFNARFLVRGSVLFALVLGPATSFAQKPKAQQISKKRKGNCEYPAWSPDGKSIAYERVFVSDKKIEMNAVLDVSAPKEVRLLPKIQAGAGGASAAFLKGQKQKAKPGDVCRDFSWGPKDSPSDYVFACNVRGQSYQLFYGEGLNQITRNAASGQPKMQQDAYAMVFLTSRNGKEGIFVFKNLIESLEPLPLFPTGSAERIDRMPVWSPDGRKIAFVGHNKNSADIYVVDDINNPKPRRVTYAPGDEVNPSWSPDGTKLAFFGNSSAHKLTKGLNEDRSERRGTGEAIYIVDVTPGSEPVLVVRDVVKSEKRGPAWTPDGQWLIYVKDRLKGDLVDPIRAVRAEKKAKEVKLKTGTVSNKDPDVTLHDGKWWATFSAQGLYKKKGSHTWRKIYVFPLDQIQNAK